MQQSTAFSRRLFKIFRDGLIINFKLAIFKKKLFTQFPFGQNVKIH